MSWTDTNWKLVDGVNESLPYSTQLTTIIDSIDTTYSPKVCWVPFQLTGDTTTTLIKYRGTEIVDTIDNSNIKFVFHKDGYENFELPKTTSYNIDIPGAAKGLQNLTSVTIPTSVKYIDHYAFWNTGLTEVTIAADCKYQRTSFPLNCIINTIDTRPFTCDSEYYVDTSVVYTIDGRDYRKYTSDPAVGMIVVLNASGSPYTIGLFISPISEDAVKYVTEGSIWGSAGSITYDGITWYYSDAGYAMGGSISGSGMTNYPTQIDYPYTQEILTAVLESVHAHVNNNN